MNEKLEVYLRKIREKSRMTLREVEEKTGVSNAYLSQLENGKIAKPSPIVLHKLAAVYDVDYSFLMELAQYPLVKPHSKYKLRSSSEFIDLSSEEEEKLLEYLNFLRSRVKAK